MRTLASVNRWRRRPEMVFLLVVGLTVIFLAMVTMAEQIPTVPTQIHMSNKERNELKEEAREMFYHAYRAYMDNAYPADELMPLSCTGRYRGVTPSRGDLDDTLGNFSMTLVDTLDTLVVLGDLEEFESAVKLVIKDVKFDNDIIVSVFETNIRMIGGLLSGHILAEYVQKQADVMSWYRGELLEMAKDLGYRLLPAFNTSTGIPHARVNLKHGMKVEALRHSRETCTACAGTILLEFAALSRLSGEPIFEVKAHAAMDALWKMRHRSSELMGTVLNVHSGDWIRRESGVGAGIDSYYEYCLKSYILLGDERYLARFNRHYNAIMKYISQGPMLLDVQMHRPHTKTRNFMDALLAFWPGLQVLSGDLKPAVQTHEMLYQVMQMHTFIPEAFTFDFQVHWGQHHLRPEFIESTYFLYRATGDHYYLHAGKKALKALQQHARVPCGYAAVNDVRTGKHEDRMDSYVLSETFKYLFLLFSDPADLILNIEDFIFTTEAHLLPLTLGVLGNHTMGVRDQEDQVHMLDYMRSCPSPNKLFPETVRRPLRDLVTGVCPRISSPKRLRASDFQASNADHLRTVYDMGITMVSLGEGKVQLLHSFYNAKSPEDAERGLIFMQEMVELSKSNAIPNTQLQAVAFKGKGDTDLHVLEAGPSHFGMELTKDMSVVQQAVYAQPIKLCSALKNAKEVRDKIVIMERGECTFVDKARRAQSAGAVAAIVFDNTPNTSINNQQMFAMSGDGKDDVQIPVVFLFTKEAEQLMAAIKQQPTVELTLMSVSGLKERLERERADTTKTDTKSESKATP
ncbi:mannosyl-oligosaccharide alpha-1,2-mannosidase [Anopheles darlingi]|uniref:alpha-1,2-Mannosidase n=1 Tax=Anopheles darlingi TaxID=43151 RepID=W5JT02_ANODA|nr:ER degradation-enhancing alpha-mannosidase-like protein 3 [Anopheles darlingi]ETN67271.1 mannosyl-oligosaccharide alpha-1,2-mannosidase [Anopheles darlingi]